MTRSGRHRLCADLDVERLLEGGQYGGEVVHGGVAAGRKHSMQAFGWFVYLVGQGFEADGGVDEVAQQALGGFGLAIEKEVDRFVEHGVREGGVVLYAQRNGFLEVAGEGHVSSCAGLMPCAFCSFPTVRWHDRCLSVGAFMSLV